MKKLFVWVVIIASFSVMHAMEDLPTDPNAGAGVMRENLTAQTAELFWHHVTAYVLDADDTSLTEIQKGLKAGVRLSSTMNGSTVSEELVRLENDLDNAARHKDSRATFGEAYRDNHKIDVISEETLDLIFKRLLKGNDQKNRLAEVRQKAAAYDEPDGGRESRRKPEDENVRRNGRSKSNWTLHQKLGIGFGVLVVLYFGKKAYDSYKSSDEEDEF